MYYLNFKINTTVYLADGQNIASGAVVSFKPYDNSITPDNTLPCDLRWWVSESAQTNNYAQVVVCKDTERKILLNTAYLPVTVPVEQFSYTVFQGWANIFLDNIYGAKNVQILK